MSIIPDSRPILDIDDAISIGIRYGISEDQSFLLGIRGFINPSQNNRGIYDDCIAIVDKLNYETFNANSDPSRFGRGLAVLKAPQVMLYKIGIHNISKEPSRRYQALVQAGPVTIIRDGSSVEQSGYFGINIHRGGNTTPGSEGCQTIPPLQWTQFMIAINATFRLKNLSTIPYVLVET